MFVTYIFIFCLGAIIGSFLNVVILRYNTGQTVGGRSKCLNCGTQLRAIDMLPILSWFILRGKCRNCGSKFSIQYPLVELGTAILFTLIFWTTTPFISSPFLVGLSFLWNAIIFSILMIIFVYDLRHKIIPDALSYSFAIFGFVQTLFLNPLNEFSGFTTINYLNIFSGLILSAPFVLLWLVSRGRWIGLGDGKLALGIGWYLGFINGLSAVILAFWIGATFAVILLLIDKLKLSPKNITMKTEIPFAPFLIVGILIQFLWPIDLIGISLFFQ